MSATTHYSKRKKSADKEPRKLPAVCATVRYRMPGADEVLLKTVQLWENLPKWWHVSHEDQRALWVREYFQKKLPEGAVMLTAECSAPY